MFQSTLFFIILIRMFLRFIFFVILVYSTTLRYENVNINIPLFVCVSVTVQVAVTSVQAQNEVQTVCIENTSAQVRSINGCQNKCRHIFELIFSCCFFILNGTSCYVCFMFVKLVTIFTDGNSVVTKSQDSTRSGIW